MSKEGKAVQPINRDIQILIGEKINTQLCGNYLDENFFKLLECTPIIRASSLKVLSKLSIFILNQYSHAQFSSSDKKYSLRIDLTKLQGYLYLRRLVEELNESIKEVYLLSIEDIDVPELIKTLEKIKGIKVLSLPYDFDNFRTSKKFERLIQNNAATLVALKHLVLPMSVPNKMRERLVAINSSTLRNCSSSTEKERDFYAYYTKEAKYPDCLDPLPEQGIVLRISVHRYSELFRAAKRAFTGEMRNKISLLKMVAVSNTDTKSAKQILEQMAGATKYFSKLERLQFEMRMLDSWPNHYEFPPDDDDFPHVSSMVIDAQLLYNFALSWLTDTENLRNSFPFKVEAKVRLLVDYLVGQHEQTEDVLEKAMKQTEEILGQRFDKKMQWTINSGRIIGSVLRQVSGDISIEFILDYRSIRYCKEGEFKEDRRFNIGHSL